MAIRTTPVLLALLFAAPIPGGVSSADLCIYVVAFGTISPAPRADS
jgi:hypothetical protein